MAEEENNKPEAPEEKPAAEAAPVKETPAAEAPAEEKAADAADPAKEKAADAPAEGGASDEKKPAAEGGGSDEKKPAAEGGGSDEKKPAAEGDAPPAEGGKKDDKKKDIFAEIMGEEAAEAVKIHKAKRSKNIQKGIVHIAATFNNTMVTITDEKGNSIGWSSAGKMGFKGSRKSTAYAAQVVSQDACRQAMSHGLKEAEVRVKGPGAGREAAVRAVQAIGIEVSGIQDVTPIPHNGCRPKKARRV